MRKSLPTQTSYSQTRSTQDSSEVPASQIPRAEGDLSAASSSQTQLAPPSHATWIFLTLLACVLLFYFFASLWYRWLRPNPQFMGFITGIAGLVGISSLLSLQTRWGAQVAGQAVQALGMGGWSKQPWKIFLSVASVTVVLGGLLYVGSPEASKYFYGRGEDSFKAGRYSQAILISARRSACRTRTARRISS